MLKQCVEASIRLKWLMLVLLIVLLAAGGLALRMLPIDAVPDVSTVQVAVLTDAPGLSPVEVERSLTFPIETALNGMPKLTELRSVSRSGLSAVTAIFKDDVDIWLARQMVLERVRSVESELPKLAGKPQLSPVSGGLGEIFQFVVRSAQHSPMQLRTLLDWEIAPKLRQSPGIVEINTMGGDLKEYQILIDAAQLHAHKLTLADVTLALSRANVNVGGGYIERKGEALTLRGVGLLADEEEIGAVVVRTAEDGTPILVRNVGRVQVGAAMRFGTITRDGEGEAVTGIAMMLVGANGREVVAGVKQRVREIQTGLPPGVIIEAIYDRSEFLGRTLAAVTRNLVEGALVVTLVLTLFLGSLRGAFVVVLGIPAAMSIALFGMHYFGITGDLMSLGAIDFGFLVDGPIVILEAMIAALAGKTLIRRARDGAYSEVAGAVSRPVGFSVAIIMLVYLPLLSLEGIEGKMFRPMAVTMACALFGALVYSVLFFPALLAIFVPPSKGHGPRWVSWVSKRYERVLPWAVEHRVLLLAAFGVALLGSFAVLARSGADFVPRIAEGDAVVTVRRAPSIGLAQAKELDLAAERVLARFPEVVTSLGMTGRAEVAIDPVGNDNTDIFVHLKPESAWTSAHDLDELSELFKHAIESEVAGTFVSVSQPIEDKTNELISGSRADVQLAIFGDSLTELKRLSEETADIVRGIPGSGDVRVERLLGAPELTVTPDRARLARYGIKTEDALEVVRAARLGVPVGQIYEGQRRFDMKVLMPPRSPSSAALGGLFVEASGGGSVPLSEVAAIIESEGPSQVRRVDLKRTVRVEVNLRGRDLVSWVTEAQRLVDAKLRLPAGYSVEWGGQFENFERAKKRLALVVPMALAIIFAMLLWLFQNPRYAIAVFAVVPLSLIGGIMALALRGLPFSIPAAVGFIALAGVSVLNGVVLASEVKAKIFGGWPLREAILEGSAHTLRAVLTTGGVAAFGFLPMALAHGAGAEVQRPLATAVIGGIAFSTLLTMFLLPGLLALLVREPSRRVSYAPLPRLAGGVDPEEERAAG
jgi:cobalt-zinc-cadmium resistance protein CzcA